jgi:hypothetical protein
VAIINQLVDFTLYNDRYHVHQSVAERLRVWSKTSSFRRNGYTEAAAKLAAFPVNFP